MILYAAYLITLAYSTLKSYRGFLSVSMEREMRGNIPANDIFTCARSRTRQTGSAESVFGLGEALR